MIADVLKLVNDGGFVMPPLVLVTVLLWYGLGWRLYTLRRGDRRDLRVLLLECLQGKEGKPRGIVDDAVQRAVAAQPHHPAELDPVLAPLEEEMETHAAMVRTVVMVAPLLGLLGTVAGMIETFASLGSGELYSRSGGIAGGISIALLTTQMGLCIAVPGIIVGRLLELKQRRLGEELEELKDLAAGGYPRLLEREAHLQPGEL